MRYPQAWIETTWGDLRHWRFWTGFGVRHWGDFTSIYLGPLWIIILWRGLGT